MSSGHDHKSRSKGNDAKMDDEEDRASVGKRSDDDDEQGRETPRRADDTQGSEGDGTGEQSGNHGDPQDGSEETQPESGREGYDIHETSGDPQDFDSRSFLSRVSELHAKLQADNLQHVDEDFPAHELTNMVNAVTSTMSDFKQYAMHTQHELESVREMMKEIKEKVYKRIQTKGYDPNSAHEKKGLEERELEAKVAQLNKEVAKAAEELVRASQVTADTEAAAAEASLVAEQAAAEAKRIQTEYEARKKADVEARKAEEARRESGRKRREEEEKRQEEIRQAEEAKKAKLRKPEENKSPEWESWPTFTYNTNGSEFTQGIGCIVRGDPNNFKENMVRIALVEPLKKKNILGENEELVSDIISLSAAQDEELNNAIMVAVPHCTSRASAISREPVIKIEVEEDKWEELKGQEVTFENNKDVKFVQAEVKSYTNLCVVTRYKRDFLHLSKRGGRVSSNVDSRVSFSADKGTFQKVEHFVLQVQQIDSATIARVKERSTEASKLLTCSSIINMNWSSEHFDQTVMMTLPCPPNPVKAKKAAAARAAKEAKMKNPAVPVMGMNDEPPKRREKKKTKTVTRQKPTGGDDDDDYPTTVTAVTKWYMGQYGNDEDDENDSLYFAKKMPNGKWAVLEQMTIVQVKLDLLQLHFTDPISTFMVVRTRTNADARDAQHLAETIETCLKERVVGMVLRQKLANQCDVVTTVVSINRLDKTLSQLDDDGYEPGSAVNNQSHKEAAIKILNEGDTLEIEFTGNVKCQDDNAKLEFAFHSQLSSQLNFSIIEVDRYLQKGYSEYKGFAQLNKVYEIIHMPPKVKKDDSEAETGPRIEIKKDLISKHTVRIPKEDETSPRPLKKAPVTIRNSDHSLDDETVRHVAQSLGDEWIRVAHYLNIKKQRIQAILRNNSTGDEEDSKYDMLMTWMKKVPRTVNKTEILIGALMYGNRPDLVSELKDQENDFQQRRKSATGSRSAKGQRQ